MTVNGQTITLPTGSDAWAAIDTGTTGIGLPASVQAAIFAAIPDSQAGTGQYEGYYAYRQPLFFFSSDNFLTLRVG